jgi:hypothetical protein
VAAKKHEHELDYISTPQLARIGCDGDAGFEPRAMLVRKVG